MIELLLAALFQLFAVWPTATDTISEAATTTARVVRVIDGDTIDVAMDDTVVRVRYIGIDTPEPYAGTAPECYAEEASARNRVLVADQMVTLVSDTEDEDEYGRQLRYVYVDDTFVNRVLVQEGYARTLPIAPNTRHAEQLRALEAEAQTQAVGLWSACMN